MVLHNIFLTKSVNLDIIKMFHSLIIIGLCLLLWLCILANGPTFKSYMWHDDIFISEILVI